MTAVPEDAITAAAGAIWDARIGGPVPVDKGQWSNQLARAALEAAAPLIAAAERKRTWTALAARHPPEATAWGQVCALCWTRAGARESWPCAELRAIADLTGTPRPGGTT